MHDSIVPQWTTGVSCDARCLQGGENPFYCGKIESCIGAALVAGFQNNYIQIRLPPDMEDLYAERKQTIHVGGLTLPSGAIYPRRYAAELTTKAGPHPALHNVRRRPRLQSCRHWPHACAAREHRW